MSFLSPFLFPIECVGEDGLYNPTLSPYILYIRFIIVHYKFCSYLEYFLPLRPLFVTVFKIQLFKLKCYPNTFHWCDQYASANSFLDKRIGREEIDFMFWCLFHYLFLIKFLKNGPCYDFNYTHPCPPANSKLMLEYKDIAVELS